MLYHNGQWRHRTSVNGCILNNLQRGLTDKVQLLTGTGEWFKGISPITTFISKMMPYKTTAVKIGVMFMNACTLHLSSGPACLPSTLSVSIIFSVSIIRFLSLLFIYICLTRGLVEWNGPLCRASCSSSVPPSDAIYRSRPRRQRWRTESGAKPTGWWAGASPKWQNKAKHGRELGVGGFEFADGEWGRGLAMLM